MFNLPGVRQQVFDHLPDFCSISVDKKRKTIRLRNSRFLWFLYILRKSSVKPRKNLPARHLRWRVTPFRQERRRRYPHFNSGYIWNPRRACTVRSNRHKFRLSREIWFIEGKRFLLQTVFLVVDARRHSSSKSDVYMILTLGVHVCF